MAVLRRDNGCVAVYLGAPDGCRTRGGYPMPASTQWWRLELDHVRDHAAMGGKRAPSDERHLVALCTHHHQGGWATRNRPLLRDYLRAVVDVPAIEAARAVLHRWRQDTGEVMT
jgi:hypothetical protein